MHKVFCYGTLKFGFGNNDLLQNSEFVGKAETLPVFTMISMGWFPACLPDGDRIIKGEVYKVDDDVLEDLDRLEGHPSFYKRIMVNTNLGDSWMYVLNRLDYSSNSPVIESGEWSKK